MVTMAYYGVVLQLISKNKAQIHGRTEIFGPGKLWLETSALVTIQLGHVADRYILTNKSRPRRYPFERKKKHVLILKCGGSQIL